MIAFLFGGVTFSELQVSSAQTGPLYKISLKTSFFPKEGEERKRGSKTPAGTQRAQYVKERCNS